MSGVRTKIGGFVRRRSLRVNRTRGDWRVAAAHNHYLERCRRENPANAQPAAEVALAAERFAHDGFASFWTLRTGAAADAMRNEIDRREACGEEVWLAPTEMGKECGCEFRPYAGDPWIDFPQLEQLFREDIGDFLTAHYGTGFKILFGSLYRAQRQGDFRAGPQTWHIDGSPATCVNVIFYLHDTTPEDGPLEVITLDRSLALTERELRLTDSGDLDGYDGPTQVERARSWYTERIEAGEGGAVHQPHGRAGLVVPFLSDTLHRGGYPAAGHHRIAIVFNCYPSHQPTDLARYSRTGIRKDPCVPYPRDPAAQF
jgi:hypothetical protein